MRHVISGIIALTWLTVAAGVATAQPLWIDRTTDRAMAIEFVKPSFNTNNDETTFFTATWFLSTRIAATDVVTVVAEAPFSNFSLDGVGEGSSTIGNIYLGLEFHQRDAGMFFEMGVRLPTVDDNELAFLTGAFTEFVDREEAFANEALPLVFAVNHYRHHDTGLVTRVRLGSAFWLATGEREDAETFFLYGAQVGYSSESLVLLAGFTGRWFLTSGSDGDNDNFNQIGITAGPRFGRFNPAFNVRVPIDDELNDIIDFVWGLSVNVDVNS